MVKLAWDNPGTRTYETGVDHGVLYIPNMGGVYDDGVAWSGLVSVSETPSGAEANPQYADNIKYLNLISAEEFAATLECFTYPDEFQAFDGLSELSAGVVVGQQRRGVFGLSYRSRLGNDLQGDAYGYKLHLLYGCQAAPSEKAYNTVNDSPEAITFSYEISTTPVAVGGGRRPTAILTIDSTKVDATALADLEDILYGDVGTDPRLPLPDEVAALFTGTITDVTSVEPAYNSATDTITIPTTTGVIYSINGVDQVAGPVVITEDTVVNARPAPGYQFTPTSDDDWSYDYTP